MKNSNTSYFFLFVLYVIANLMLSCSAETEEPIVDPLIEPVNKISFIVNGSTFTSQVVNYTDFFQEGATVGYNPSIGATTITIAGVWNNQPASFAANFPSNNTGLFEFRNGNEDFFPTETEDIFFQLNSVPFLIKGATLQITEYQDSIGGYIKGNFFGTWDDLSNNQTVTVNSGVFELLRTK